MHVSVGDPRLAREVMVGQTLTLTVVMRVDTVTEEAVSGTLESCSCESKRGTGGLNPAVERATKILVRTMGTNA